MSALALAVAMTLAADPAAGPEPTPWYLPNDAVVGFAVIPGNSINTMVSMNVRLGWQVPFYERFGHNLIATLHVGTGLAVLLPVGMDAHYQHVALLGLAYRKSGAGVNWGFQWGIGANWYRTSYENAVRTFENRVLAYTEGRLMLGYRFFPKLVGGLYGGYASPLSYNSRFPGQTYLGGIMFGLYVDWH